MVDLSILFSVVMALFLGALTFTKHSIHFGSAALIASLWIYVCLLNATGFDYVLRGKKYSGVMHALLMGGVAAAGFYGAETSHDLIGGGVDNAAAGIYALQMAVCLGFGILALTCAIGVMRHVFCAKNAPETAEDK